MPRPCILQQIEISRTPPYCVHVQYAATLLRSPRRIQGRSCITGPYSFMISKNPALSKHALKWTPTPPPPPRAATAQSPPPRPHPRNSNRSTASSPRPPRPRPRPPPRQYPHRQSQPQVHQSRPYLRPRLRPRPPRPEARPAPSRPRDGLLRRAHHLFDKDLRRERRGDCGCGHQCCGYGCGHGNA